VGGTPRIVVERDQCGMLIARPFDLLIVRPRREAGRVAPCAELPARGVRRARLRVVGWPFVEVAPREDRRVVEGVVNHFVHLLKLVFHEMRPVLCICDTHCRPARMRIEHTAASHGIRS
jgi:hypothetical protein